MVDLSSNTFSILTLGVFLSTSIHGQAADNQYFSLQKDKNGLYLTTNSNNAVIDFIKDGKECPRTFVEQKSYLNITPDRIGELIFLQSNETKMKKVHVSIEKR